MTPPPDATTVALRLPGRWQIRATNSTTWTRGERHDPVLVYQLVSTHPIVLSDAVEYRDERRGPRSVTGTDTQVDARDGIAFVRRPSGLLRGRRVRWWVVALDEGLLVTRSPRSRRNLDGIDVLAPEGSDDVDLRRTVGERVTELGISVEEFAGLTWFS